MEAKQIKDLMEAYASVYTQSEEEFIEEDLHGTVKAGLEKGAEFMKKNPVGRAVGAVLKPVGKGRGTVTKREQKSKIKDNVKEDFENWVNSLVEEGYDLSEYTWDDMYEIYEDYEPDIFDIILEHLVAEGYADTNENALVIMANMSEEWIESIFQQNLNEVIGMGRVAFKGFKTALKRGMKFGLDPESKAYAKQVDLENRVSAIRNRLHRANRGVKNAPQPQDNPEIRKLEGRIDRINSVRRRTPPQGAPHSVIHSKKYDSRGVTPTTLKVYSSPLPAYLERLGRLKVDLDP